MKRFDYLTPVGFMLGCIIVAIGILSGTDWRESVHFRSDFFLIVTGGLAAAIFISFPPRDLKKPLLF